jgi:hypothetical protein
MKVLLDNKGINSKIIKHLEETFPNVLPLEFITEQQLSYLQGQQSVVNHCRGLLEEELEEKQYVHG